MLGQAQSHSRDVRPIKIGDLPSPFSPREQRALVGALRRHTVKIAYRTEASLEDSPLMNALIEQSLARSPHVAHLGEYYWYL